MTHGIPDRFAVDSRGFTWRVWDDEDHWSMACTTSDNEPIPQPITWFDKRDDTKLKIYVVTGKDLHVMAVGSTLEKAKSAYPKDTHGKKMEWTYSQALRQWEGDFHGPIYINEEVLDGWPIGRTD